MAISTEGKIGIALGLVSLVGAGAIAVAPDNKVIGWAIVAFGLWGLLLLGLYVLWERRRGSAPPLKVIGGGAAVSLILSLISVAVVAHFQKPAPKVAATEPTPSVDPHGLCFISFKVWHHDQKIAITANVQNRNKDMVLQTLVGRDFTVEGFPKPLEEEVPEAKPLYPEVGLVTLDSQVVVLGKDIPKWTVLNGRVFFLVRYGPAPSNTAVLKIKGRVPIVVGGLKTGEDAAFWRPDRDSTPDCPGVKELIGPDADLTLKSSSTALPNGLRPRPPQVRGPPL